MLHASVNQYVRTAFDDGKSSSDDNKLRVGQQAGCNNIEGDNSVRGKSVEVIVSKMCVP
jgi:hypothetical protein